MKAERINAKLLLVLVQSFKDSVRSPGKAYTLLPEQSGHTVIYVDGPGGASSNGCSCEYLLTLSTKIM